MGDNLEWLTAFSQHREQVEEQRLELERRLEKHHDQVEEQCQELERKVEKVATKKGTDIDELHNLSQSFSEHFAELERKVYRTDSGFEQLRIDHNAIQSELKFRTAEWAT